MQIDVLLSSGETDEWEGVTDAVMDMDLGGTLTVLGESTETDEGTVAPVLARYAPGMWMKVEYNT